jgi:hypothetical protein
MRLAALLFACALRAQEVRVDRRLLAWRLEDLRLASDVDLLATFPPR